ncbi:predicted protein [Uncinocarpus reesii 1704]|uniref:Uncharacterized protein n=1 Tax=Uncinocarpus reesii (strain UAMH 1704) TaxID=336963 RepID=C4JHP8_UNCRE|nr:uncharacterized protein UREG_02734 [Uncinocarpus reesii 1704]EEP77885.1 predicted protein [Uncinocarpus reesii 1704]
MSFTVFVGNWKYWAKIRPHGEEHHECKGGIEARQITPAKESEDFGGIGHAADQETQAKLQSRDVAIYSCGPLIAAEKPGNQESIDDLREDHGGGHESNLTIGRVRGHIAWLTTRACGNRGSNSRVGSDEGRGEEYTRCDDGARREPGKPTEHVARCASIVVLRGGTESKCGLANKILQCLRFRDYKILTFVPHPTRKPVAATPSAGASPAGRGGYDGSNDGAIKDTGTILDAIPSTIGIFSKPGRPMHPDNKLDMPKTLPLCWRRPEEP